MPQPARPQYYLELAVIELGFNGNGGKLPTLQASPVLGEYVITARTYCHKNASVTEGVTSDLKRLKATSLTSNRDDERKRKTSHLMQTGGAKDPKRQGIPIQ